MSDVIARGLAKKANNEINNINITLNGKANQADLDTVSSQLAQKANQEEMVTGIFSRKSTASIKKAVVFIDDDARTETFTRFKPIADEKGIKFSFCVITNKPGATGYMTWEEITQMHNEGFDVLSHTHTSGQMSSMDEETLNFELSESKKILQEKGFKAEHLVYPGGAYNKFSNDVTRKYYKSGIAINAGINTIPIENYIVTRYNLDTSSLTTLKGLVDSLNSTSGALVFMMHTFNENWTPTKEQDLRDLIDYIKSLNINILTWSEAFNHFGNVVEVGSKSEGQYLKVDPYGNLHNQNYNNLATKRYARNSLSFNTAPSYFTGNEISITDFNGDATDSGFPERKEGLLVTISGFDTKYQYWYPFDSGMFYVRRKHTTQDTWLNFYYGKPMYSMQTISFGDIPAHSTKDVDVTIPGVIHGNTIVTVNAHWGLTNGIMLMAWTRSDNTVRVRAANVTASTVNIPDPTQYKFNIMPN